MYHIFQNTLKGITCLTQYFTQRVTRVLDTDQGLMLMV